MRLRCLAIYLLVLGNYLQIWGLLLHVIAVEDTVVLNHVLEAEIDATKQQLELYQHKAELLSNAITKLQSRNGHKTMQNATKVGDLVSESPPHRRSKSRESPQLFRDWFEPHGTFKPLNGVNSTRMLIQLISFRPNTSPVGRRQQSRRKNINDEPPLQFLLVLDQDSTVMRLFHPTTFELMWQHALDLRSTSGNDVFRVADMFFMSDRSAHLAILSTSGDLALFKLRLWHSRRIVAGDTRRLRPLRDLEENYLQCPVGQDSINVLEASQPPWLQQSIFTLTAPASGRYLHVDVEHVFGAPLNHDWHYDRGKVAVVPLYYRVFVVTSDNSGDHLSLFHGDNGSFIEDIHTQIDGNVVHLEPIHSSRGLVALATQSRVFFVDAGASQLIPVVCEAPGRHTFTSLSVDPLRATIVYAGTSTGRVLVYKLHNLGSWRQRVDMNEPEAHGPIMCTLVDQLMPRRPPLPAFGRNVATVVQTLPGFLLFGVGARLMLYQLSGSSDEVQPTYLSELSLVESFTLELNGINQTTQHPRILGLSAAKDLIVHSTGFAVLVVFPDNAHHLHIYESRIPPPGTNLDLTWVRVPAMMICALAAMYYQKKGSAGRSAFNEAEVAGLLSGRGRFPTMGTTKRGGLTTHRGANDCY